MWNRTWTKIIFFLLPVIYCVVYAPYGLNDVDGGYVMSAAYRLVSGQIPYRDFIIVRPPMFALLHSLVLLITPSAYQVFCERILFYIFFAIISFLSAQVIYKLNETKSWRIDKYIFASIIFIFSVHNFPPMPWTTVDGIFFGIIGIYFLTISETTLSSIIGFIFLVLSALTKQSFYLMPVFGLLFSVFYLNKRNVFAGLITILIMSAIFYMTLLKYGISENYFKWTSGSLEIRDLIQAGIISYIRPNVIVLIAILFSGFIFLNKYKQGYYYKYSGWLIALQFLYFISSVIYKSIFHPVLNINTVYPQFLFLLSFIYSVFLLFKKDKRAFILLFMLSLSWSSSISWGYQTPLFYSAPFFASVFFILKEELKFRRMEMFGIPLLVLIFIMNFFSYQNVYRNGKRNEMTYCMSEIFPKLSGIKSNKNTYEKYSEFKNLSQKYPDFVTLPSMTLSHFLTDSESAFSVDWAMDIEVNHHPEVLIDELNKSHATVFLEKFPEFDINSKQWGSDVARNVVEHWKMTGETKYFKVYSQF